MPIGALLPARWTRRSPRRRARRGRRPALPRLHHRRARRARRSTRSPTTGSTSTTPSVEGRPHPELRLVVAVPGEGRPHLPRARVLRERGRRDVDASPTTTSIEQGKRELAAARARRRRRKVEAGYVVRMPKAYPVYDEHYKDNVDDAARVARGERAQRVSRAAATACTSTTTRTTRCSPRCSRSRTSSAPTTTCGRSTSRTEYHEHTSDGQAERDRSRRAAPPDACARRGRSGVCRSINRGRCRPRVSRRG